ncbi:hypothetical protein UFOVP1605_38 [uncultured Caudovirales phage]|uniref:Uncharacterized protein n=1 Tax=uncultured Caudovirales phage TaxID=2100421 RepID=A0A6J5SVJ6_9CAUD|nr:hypothetical protein UFOVP1605_38 [uncultured Caudovirales phage]
MSYCFTFETSYTIKITSETEDIETFISVYAKKYPQAVKKIIAMQLPGINDESDLKWISVQEEVDMEDAG